MFSPKGPEWIVILVVVLLIFGARKLPELARSLGASAKEFRKGIQEGSEEAAATGESPQKASATSDTPQKTDNST
ncbi:MAG: twin-arginine translocase TatA/TatE family subunit [Acidimicrobiia bacterium]